MITVRSTINIAGQTVPQIIPVVQGDTGRSILFTLADFTIPTGSTARYYIQKPSGNAVYNNATIEDNNVVVNLTAQAIAEIGDNYGQVRIENDGEIVTSFDFILLVKAFRGIGAVESETEMNIFDQAVEQAEAEITEAKEEALAEIAETGSGNIAVPFDAADSYLAGEYVIYNAKFYKFTSAHTGPWTGSDAEELTVGDALTDLEEETTSLKEDLTYKADNKYGGTESSTDVPLTNKKTWNGNSGVQNANASRAASDPILKTPDMIAISCASGYSMVVMANDNGIRNTAPIIGTAWVNSVDLSDVNYKWLFISIKKSDGTDFSDGETTQVISIKKGEIIPYLTEDDISYLNKTSLAVSVFADKFDKINIPSSSVGTLAATKKWVVRFVKAGTYVKDFSLQVHVNSTEFASIELWETNDGETYTLSHQIYPQSVTAMTNQYKLSFPDFYVEKDGFICTSDTHSNGTCRRTTMEGSKIPYFNKSVSSITINEMSILTDSTVCYAIEAYSPLPSDKAIPVTVKKDGTGTYTDILTAMQNEDEGTPIYIYPGIYNQDMSSCLKKRVILIGTDRNQCIIRDTDGRYSHHPLYVSCGYFENLTIISPYVHGESNEIGATDTGSYAVHVDADDDYGIGKALEFHHCTMKSDFFPAVGIGLRKDIQVIFDDCEMVNNQIEGRGKYTSFGSLGALYFHDSNGEQGDQYITIKDCVLTSSLGNSMTPSQVSRDPQNNKVFCRFINNVLHDELNGYSNNIWFRGDPFNSESGIFKITVGYGNSNSSLNNN